MTRLGLIDWGIGGVSVYKLIREEMGDVPVTYFSDTGVTPYGKMTRPELVGRLNAVIEYLKTKGVTHVVIGCNSASTAVAFLADHHIPVEGVIDPAIKLTARLKPSRLGLIGGRRTVLSGVYRRAFDARGISLEQRIAQPLSGLIEAGDISSQELRDEARRILTPIRRCSHILLACTHYPAITPVLKTFVSANTVFIDPAAELVRTVSRWKFAAGGESRFLTSGDPDLMKTAAERAFGVEIRNVSNVFI